MKKSYKKMMYDNVNKGLYGHFKKNARFFKER